MFRRNLLLALCLVLLTGWTLSANAFRDDIVAAWTMDEGSGNVVSDVSGNGNHGEAKDGVEWVDGRFGKALRFDGSSGYVEIPFADSLKLLNQGDFTIAAWVITDEVPGENKEVFQQGDSNGTGRTWLFIASGAGEVRSYLGGNSTFSGFNLVPSEWTHLAVTVTEEGNPDTTQVYINGKAMGDPGALGMEDSEGPYFIGCHKNLTSFWQGIIDDVVLVKKALNERELTDLMDNGVAGVLAVHPEGKLAVRWGGLKRR